MEFVYNQDQIVAMSSNEIKLLGLLCPKKVFMQLETSGSPSVWTNRGESLKGFSGNDVVRCAEEIRAMNAECADYNNGQHGDNRRNFCASIRVVF